ncbi:iron complex transport system substrate-binding protein [Roseivivax halotolerans]|uniref:Iron complex transport system substrate-binding protein n=1 Tax=Roseivivax halotolerans TaxID=93684 RepID=A0A1I6A6G2_9RHOB|nr:ABC transporter substrate-binding protein [Roseivivax halotolerans]SFQ64213.1 iron complex transport system substrate-binding protein [Roseivivax halotolerans]
MKLAITTLVALAALATPAFARDCAEGQRLFEHDAGADCIPSDPQRIVSLHDSVLTITLLELGVMPVGSHGRLTDDGEPFIRSARTLTGIDFDNSDIAFVGAFPVDLEAIAALDPDLILTTQWQDAPVERLRQIAPTALIDYSRRGDWGTYATVADIVGEADRIAAMETRYAAAIDQIRERIDTENITISTIHAHDTSLFVYNPYGNIGRVLYDAGFRQPQAVLDVPLNDWAEVSAETLPAFDGDFIITTFNGSTADTPEDVRGYFDAQVPGYCDLLHACRTGQMFILPREEASATSYDALLATAYAIQSIVGGRPFEPMPE